MPTSADAPPDGGLDTADRDVLFDLLGLHFTGCLWPRSGGTEATRRFAADLHHAMVAAGWKVDSFAVASYHGSAGYYANASWPQRCGEY
jgi:hypothetical protein